MLELGIAVLTIDLNLTFASCQRDPWENPITDKKTAPD
jgi:hypothetical protein